MRENLYLNQENRLKIQICLGLAYSEWICLVGLWQKSRGTGGQVAFCGVFFFDANGTGIAKALRGSQFSGCKAKGAMLKTKPKLKNCHFFASVVGKTPGRFFFSSFFS